MNNQAQVYVHPLQPYQRYFSLAIHMTWDYKPCLHINLTMMEFNPQYCSYSTTVGVTPLHLGQAAPDSKSKQATLATSVCSNSHSARNRSMILFSTVRPGKQYRDIHTIIRTIHTLTKYIRTHILCYTYICLHTYVHMLLEHIMHSHIPKPACSQTHTLYICTCIHMSIRSNQTNTHTYTHTHTHTHTAHTHMHTSY